MKLGGTFYAQDSVIYTIEIEDDVYVDVKHIGDLWYVMACEDGKDAYSNNCESVDYDVNHESVIGFAKKKESFINRMAIW